jgi:hypothetical protein
VNVNDKKTNQPFLTRVYYVSRRLNKIGKNPNIMAQKDEADGNHDTNTISAVVNALAAEAENHNNR